MGKIVFRSSLASSGAKLRVEWPTSEDLVAHVGVVGTIAAIRSVDSAVAKRRWS